ncbi:MAG TPA: hypothetical protein VNY05_24340 [Candidatus Acidoferrales bacterium]|nr:hypothetical protein [Candidatus Acidoferrales bacterium]
MAPGAPSAEHHINPRLSTFSTLDMADWGWPAANTYVMFITCQVKSMSGTMGS